MLPHFINGITFEIGSINNIIIPIYRYNHGVSERLNYVFIVTVRNLFIESAL